MSDEKLNVKLFSDEPEMRMTREGYGDGLAEVGGQDERVVVLTADLKDSTKVDKFASLFPERFVECGVAEQNMTGIAAGMAAAGKRPFVSSYAVFSPGRSWDQVRVSVCYSNLPVVIGGAHTGLSVGPDGATHQALEDIAITRCLPNMNVEVPCDYWETLKAVREAIRLGGPTYIRFAREKTAVVTTEKSQYKVGQAEILYGDGGEVAIVACGPVVYQSLIAAKELESEGIKAVVVNNHSIKPIDKKTIMEVAEKCGAMVTVEEHQIMGGMGSAVAEVLVQSRPIPIEMVGVRDRFGESGKPEELLEKYGISVKSIKDAVRKVISRK